MTSYAQTWTSSLLNSVIEDAAISIQKGEVVGSFVKVVQDSLRMFMAPLIKSTLSKLLNNSNLETVYTYLEKEKSDLETSNYIRQILAVSDVSYHKFLILLDYSY